MYQPNPQTFQGPIFPKKLPTKEQIAGFGHVIDLTGENFRVRKRRLVRAEVDELTKQAEAQEKELEADFKRLVEEKRLCEVFAATNSRLTSGLCLQNDQTKF